MDIVWHKARQSFTEARMKGNDRFRYSVYRDMATVIRHVMPVAVEMAVEAKPEWKSADSPLADVAGKYALALSSKELALDVMVDGLAPMLKGDEHAEAYALFSTCFTSCFLMYMLLIPHLATAVGELHPDLPGQALSSIADASLFSTAEGFWPFRWLKRWLRKRDLMRSIRAGTLPKSDWVARFVRQKASGTFWDILNAMIQEGNGVAFDDGPPVDGENQDAKPEAATPDEKVGDDG